MPDELELKRSLFGAHRLDGELLRSDDLRASLFFVTGNAHRTSGRNAVAACLPAPALATGVLHLAKQLVGQLVNRGLHVGRGLGDAKRRALRPDCQLRDLVVGDRRVLLDAKLELDLSQVVQLAAELAHLFLGVPANRVADLDVLALHLKSHAPPREPGISP